MIIYWLSLSIHYDSTIRGGSSMIVLLMSTPKRNMAAAMTSWARNSAEALLFADWWTMAGELEVAGASGALAMDNPWESDWKTTEKPGKKISH